MRSHVTRSSLVCLQTDTIRLPEYKYTVFFFEYRLTRCKIPRARITRALSVSIIARTIFVPVHKAYAPFVGGRETEGSTAKV